MFFFFNATATTEIYTLSLHDALPIFAAIVDTTSPDTIVLPRAEHGRGTAHISIDRKSTRLNSSHSQISYAVFCLKKKTNQHASPSCCPRRLGRVSWRIFRRPVRCLRG